MKLSDEDDHDCFCVVTFISGCSLNKNRPPVLLYIKIIPTALIASRFIRQLIFLLQRAPAFTQGKIYHSSAQKGGRKFGPSLHSPLYCSREKNKTMINGQSPLFDKQPCF